MKIPDALKWKHTGKTLGKGGQAQILEVVDKTSDSEQTYALKPLGKPKTYFRKDDSGKGIRTTATPRNHGAG